MARQFTGTNDYRWVIKKGTVPLTIAGWFHLASTTGNAGFGLSNISSTNVAILTWAWPTTQLQCANPANVFCNGLSSTTGTWIHFVGVVASDSSRIAYINNTPTSINTTASTQNCNIFSINGCYFPGGVYQYLTPNIRCSMVAFWNAALTADEVNSLYKNIHPRKIRPQSLGILPDLETRNLRELRYNIGNFGGGTPTFADNPRMYL